MQSLRTAEVSRKTQETAIDVRINLDGTGRSEIDTGIGFLDPHASIRSPATGWWTSPPARRAICRSNGHHTVEDYRHYAWRARF